jgi:hypothetical protein
MRNALIFIGLLTACSGALAGTDCKTDWRGVLVCVETGSPSYGNSPNGGYQEPRRTETKTDWRGYDVTTDNKGNKTECKTDWRGHYVCN